MLQAKNKQPRQGFFEITYCPKDTVNELAKHCLIAVGFVMAMHRFVALDLGKPAHIREVPAKEYRAWLAAAGLINPDAEPVTAEAQP